MSTNIGSLDRAVRFVVGVALLAWAIGYLPGLGASNWGWIGIIPLATSLIGWCPLYTVLGFNTCGGAPKS